MSGLGKTPSDLEIGAEFRNRGHFREMRVFFIFFLEINEINSRELAETPIFRWFSCGFIKNIDFSREICVFMKALANMRSAGALYLEFVTEKRQKS